ncbi:putative transposase/integrase [Rhodococcus opacus M213]|uniref:Putative transposase/integrase n=2 Tax=Rhodococcus opacus TaxID=37919 RepID=K8XF17_RHOOP|nr:putative transposase/integrase [Rhodococcus opacus M213]
MIRVQSVASTNDERTWTVLGRDHLPLPAVELYLEHLRQTRASPNTIRSYARALALWFQYLDLLKRPWEDARLEDATGYIAWLRTGLHPDVVPIGDMPPRMADSTIATRIHGMQSFYTFHQWRGLEVAPWLYSGGAARNPSYRPFLHHVNHRRPQVTIRVRSKRTTPPTLTPRQIEAIKDSCARFDEASRSWSGCLRDRLLFQLLEETGLRIGEALSLQHRDWHVGRGENPFIEVVPRRNPHGLRQKSGYRKVYLSDATDRLYGEYVWQLCDLGMAAAVDDMNRTSVFVNINSGRTFAPLHPDTVYKLVDRLRKRLGTRVPARWSPHWFRHTHATALLLSGTPVHVVSRRLGHRDVQTTLNTYAWVTEDEELKSIADWTRVTQTWRVQHGQIP